MNRAGLLLTGLSALFATTCQQGALVRPRTARPSAPADWMTSREAQVSFSASHSTVTVTTAAGTSTTALEGMGQVPGDPCATERCVARGRLFGFPPADDGGARARGSFAVNLADGWLLHDGTLELPAGAEGSVCGIARELDGGHCWQLATPRPLTGTVDFEQRGVVLAGELTAQGVEVTFNLVGTITNRPPTARAGADRQVPCEDTAGAWVELDGSASSDPDGEVTFSTWVALEGPLVPTTPEPGSPRGQHLVGRELRARVHAPPGQHLFRLTLMDHHLQIASATVRVTVGPEGCPTASDAAVAPAEP